MTLPVIKQSYTATLAVTADAANRTMPPWADHNVESVGEKAGPYLGLFLHSGCGVGGSGQ